MHVVARLCAVHLHGFLKAALLRDVIRLLDECFFVWISADGGIVRLFPTIYIYIFFFQPNLSGIVDLDKLLGWIGECFIWIIC